mgnify:CR=1 FL=1|tara:strand:+ start:629 stop:2401 length:1773 start_codon:yes stop_codon:yes gene_type:complete
MSYSKTSGFMDFFSGFKEAGDKYDKENFLIRAEDLKAKRDAIIEMKKVKYNDDIAQYKKDKEKIDSLNSLKAQFGSGEIDAKDYGLRYTMATKGSAEIANIRKVFERDREGFDNYFANIGKSDPLKNDTVFKNFKERSVIDSNYLDSINAINSKYSNMLKTAKNDSVLVNAILGKRDAEIAELTLNEGTTKNNIEVADKVNEIKTTTTKPGEETDSSKEVESLSSYTITDKDRVYGVPQWWKEESKIATIRKEVKKGLKNTDKEAVNTTLTIFKDLNIALPKNFLRYEQGKSDGAVIGFKENGITLNNQIGLLTKQGFNFQTDLYLYNKTGGETTTVSNFYSVPDNTDLVTSRISDYTGSDNIQQSKKGMFEDRQNFVTIVPFSIVDLDNNFGNINIDRSDRQKVGNAYYKALVTIAKQDNPKYVNDADPLNKMQGDLLKDKDGSSALASRVKKEMEKTLKIGEQKTPTDSKGDLPEGVYYEINGEAFEINDNNTKLIIERGGNPDDFKKIGKLKEEGGDGSVAESVVGVNQNVFRDDKIKPEGELGDIKFATLESVLKILPEAMSGAEIKEKYAIDFPINEKTIFRPLK